VLNRVKRVNQPKIALKWGMPKSKLKIKMNFTKVWLFGYQNSNDE
jgi:hypothetical protein